METFIKQTQKDTKLISKWYKCKDHQQMKWYIKKQEKIITIMNHFASILNARKSASAAEQDPMWPSKTDPTPSFLPTFFGRKTNLPALPSIQNLDSRINYWKDVINKSNSGENW